ncbi:hypothetical protein ACCS53_39625, partial [Rhizobium ruizarguesonis]
FFGVELFGQISGKEVAHHGDHLVRLFFEGEMSSVEEMKFGFGNVAKLSARRRAGRWYHYCPTEG